jgi:hypothetical protein
MIFSFRCTEPGFSSYTAGLNGHFANRLAFFPNFFLGLLYVPVDPGCRCRYLYNLLPCRVLPIIAMRQVGLFYSPFPTQACSGTNGILYRNKTIITVSRRADFRYKFAEKTADTRELELKFKPCLISFTPSIVSRS